eukprot:gene3727-biopygen5231
MFILHAAASSLHSLHSAVTHPGGSRSRGAAAANPAGARGAPPPQQPQTPSRSQQHRRETSGEVRARMQRQARETSEEKRARRQRQRYHRRCRGTVASVAFDVRDKEGHGLNLGSQYTAFSST